ncbi:7SK snRNA methylphosphate capping enzyme-like [Phymastichus coffea]|uniref:7SK snRNA methylphosphate capping enzyme-like n=1 Tax=Phymastichus coffea TaxID=108790 RepID=UPI00273AE23E|nr:7SK snRNA methylphosphate capping enzyme-like [Phymastichus coffea]
MIMSSATLDHPLKMGNKIKKGNENTKADRISNATHKKHKEDKRHLKFNRKRIQNFTGNGKFCPPYKRRKKESFITPTKFLLGGSINDPLNLNSMQDEEVNRAMNAVTPKSSPLPTPKHRKEAIEVIIPPNPSDPLNLNNLNDDDYEKRLMSPVKKNGKKRNRVRNRKKSLVSLAVDSNKSEEIKTNQLISVEDIQVTQKVEENIDKEQPQKFNLTLPKSLSEETERPKEEPTIKEPKLKLKIKCLDEIKDKRMRKLDIKDKIVSPVIPQPGAWKSRPQYRPNHHHDKKKKHQKQPNFKDKNAKFQYGNYNQYYGYRNHQERDTRLTVFSQRTELFYQKDVLDVGCNIGHITLSIARDFGATSVTGLDIDKKLIGIARKNIKHYVICAQSPAQTDDRNHKNDTNIFPTSMLINYGPIDIPGFENPNKHKGFPYNVTFVQGNYVVDDDLLSTNQMHQFDTILCLSVTKWIHLNFGDAGLKRCFKRMYAQLKPGGVLVLEPQNWSSYTKKKTLTEKIYKNFHAIKLKPPMFTKYLLSDVGFLTCEVVSVPPHPSKGFRRPIYLYTKSYVILSPESPLPTLSELGASVKSTDQEMENSGVVKPFIKLKRKGQEFSPLSPTYIPVFPVESKFISEHLDNDQNSKIDSEDRRLSEESQEQEDNEASQTPKPQEDKT